MYRRVRILKKVGRERRGKGFCMRSMVFEAIYLNEKQIEDLEFNMEKVMILKWTMTWQ